MKQPEAHKVVRIFRTDLETSEQATALVAYLLKVYPAYRINVDLDDCDKVLRVETQQFDPNAIITLVESIGYSCEEIIW